MTEPAKVVVVGAGPAGVRAAQTLVSAGLRPVVLDENPRWGGQIYRQPPADAGFARSPKTLYGFEANNVWANKRESGAKRKRGGSGEAKVKSERERSVAGRLDSV